VNPVWLIPMAALLVGGAAIVAFGRSALEESRLLVEELGRQRDVAAALRRLGDGLADLGATLPRQ
jgi:hypothetical protein